MSKGIIASLATLVLGLAACGGDDEGETTAATTTMTTTMSTTDPTAGSESGAEESGDMTTTASTTGSTTMPATTAPAEESGSEDPGTTTDVNDVTGPAEESSTGLLGSPCDPDPAMDDDCQACTKANCCMQLETCFADPICECMSGCVMGPADFGPCEMKCGMTGNFMPVTDCAASMCLLECIG